MKQALHIFKKDVGYLRYDIGLTLLAAVAFCFLRNPIMLPTVWWFLIARVIHAEALPGNRHFWRTRPYEWPSLLGAKILFVLVFVHLPLLIGDAVIIHAAGFSVWREMGGLIWTQALVMGAVVLPVAALAAITSGLIEILAVTVLLVFGFLVWIIFAGRIHAGVSWKELEWVKLYVLIAELAAGAAIILVWQYARRNTLATRMVAVATAVTVVSSGSLIPWRPAFDLQAHFSQQSIDPSIIRISLDHERKWLGRVYATGEGQMVADLPLEIEGLPPGMEFQPNGLTVTLYARDGATRVVDEPPPACVAMEAGITSLRAAMGKDFYAKVKDEPLRIGGTVYFTLYGHRRSDVLPLNGRSVRVNGIGICAVATRLVTCHSVFRPQSDWAALQVLQDSGKGPRRITESSAFVASYSPFPADLNINPLFALFSEELGEISDARVETSEPLAHLQQDFEISNVRLSDFVQSPSSHRD